MFKVLFVFAAEDEHVLSLWVAMFVNLLPGITSKLVKVTLDPKIIPSIVKALFVETRGHYVTNIFLIENFPPLLTLRIWRNSQRKTQPG